MSVLIPVPHWFNYHSLKYYCCPRINTCKWVPRMFDAVLFEVAKDWSQPRGLSIVIWQNKMCFILNMEYHGG